MRDVFSMFQDEHVEADLEAKGRMGLTHVLGPEFAIESR